MSHQISTIYFDLGKVLVHFDWAAACERMATHSSSTPPQIHKEIASGDLVARYERGELTTSDFLSLFGKKIGFREPSGYLKELWSDIFTPIDEHVAMIGQVKPPIQVGILSNTNEAHMDWIHDRFHWFRSIRPKVLSCEVGFRKPELEIYDIAAKRAGALPGEILFVDDLPDNVTAAQKAGWHAVRATPGESLRQCLRASGWDHIVST